MLAAPSVYVSPNYQVILPQHVITLVGGRRYMIQPCHVMIVRKLATGAVKGEHFADAFYWDQLLCHSRRRGYSCS